MILERSTSYWSTGISLTWHPDGARDLDHKPIPGWTGTVEYYDDSWQGDDDADAGLIGTQGELTTRYVIADGETRTALTAIVDALLADAGRLGIRFGSEHTPPRLYVPGDGEWKTPPLPDGWRELLADQAQRIGWNSYGVKPAATA